MSEQLPELACACATARRAARLVTQLYSQEMQGTVDPPQFSVLSAISAHPGINQSRFGAAMGLDKTTVSRNLRVMENYGWIERLERGYTLTPTGRKMLASAKPAWLRAQAKLRAALKPGGWEELFGTFNRVAEAADQAGSKPDAPRGSSRR